MYKMSRLASLVTLTLSACLITACSDGKDKSVSSADTGHILVANYSPAVPGANLSIDLKENTCSDKKITTVGSVKWSVTIPTVTHIKIIVGDNNLLTYAGPTGSVSTDKWVQDGTKFTLIDADKKSTLGTLVVSDSTCKK